MLLWSSNLPISCAMLTYQHLVNSRSPTSSNFNTLMHHAQRSLGEELAGRPKAWRNFASVVNPVRA